MQVPAKLLQRWLRASRQPVRTQAGLIPPSNLSLCQQHVCSTEQGEGQPWGVGVLLPHRMERG